MQASWRASILNFFLGVTLVFAFAPWQWFILTLLIPGLLERRLYRQNPRSAFKTSFAFGLGFFGLGVSWIFFSIHDYSQTPLWSAIFITLAFVGLMALVFSTIGVAYVFFKPVHHLSRSFFFALIWVLQEGLRSLIFTGFPWLLLGDTWVDTPFRFLAPIAGVYGLSFFSIAASVLLMGCFEAKQYKHQLLCFSLFCSIGLISASTRFFEWTHPVSELQNVGLAQGNIPQDLKWDVKLAEDHYATYFELTERLNAVNLIVWPEAAFPFALPQAKAITEDLSAQLIRHDQALIMGALVDGPSGYTNSMVTLGKAAGQYHKYHLVPFGEYVPFARILGNAFDWLQLPMSFTQPGKRIQPPLQAGPLALAPLICYEIAFPELVRLRALSSNILLTISNDTWFGRSLGPLQHLNIARMRALETGRMLIRATNNGMTAIIATDGGIQKIAPPDVESVLSGPVQAYSGLTPIMRLGHDNLLILMLHVFALSMLYFYRLQYN